MNVTIKIRIATINDLNNIYLLFKNVIYDIHKVKKIDMWNDKYPFCEFENYINQKEMYVIESKNKIIGSFALSEKNVPKSQIINWTSKYKKHFSLNILAINPKEQGKGIANMVMNYIDSYAIKNNYEVIRLIVYKDNIWAINLYKKYGFKKIENSQWIFNNKIFWGFEKEIK